MRLPNAEDAQVDPKKLQQYLLSETHPIGRWKAVYFRRLGFNASNMALLKEGLIGIAKTGDLTTTVTARHGTKYVVDGNLATPSGDQIQLRTVWIIEKGQDRPRFVTAYPE